MLISIINQSKLVSNQDVQTMSSALQTQFNLNVASAWNQKAPTVSFYSDLSKVPGYAWVISVSDTPDVADALGYHDETNDKIDGFIFCSPVLDNGGVVLYDAKNPQNVSVSSVLSHEACEMFGDRFANFWADGPSITANDGYSYSEYALELCDPVQGNSYVVNVGSTPVSVSNFIFPSWFNQEATSVNLPFDYMNQLKSPFTMSSGGYMIVRQSGNVQQVFGETMPNWQKELKKISGRITKRK